MDRRTVRAGPRVRPRPDDFPTDHPDVTTLFDTLVPVFGLMALGFAAARGRVVDAASARGLVLFAFNFAIPALLLTSMARLELPEDPEWGYLVAFYTASLVVYAFAAVLARTLFGRALREQAIFGMGAAFSNLVLIGLPVVLTAFGPEATLPMMVIIGFHSATFMPLTVLLIQADGTPGDPTRAGPGGGGAVGWTSRGRRVLGVLGAVVTNPIILGIVLGLAANLAGITLWSGAQAILDFLGGAAVPCALFAVGASLAGLPVGGEAPESLVLTGVKLVLHPLLVWVIAVPFLGLEGLSVSVAIVLAAMPSAVNVYLFAARYDAAPGVAARTVLLTTLGSAVTLAVVLLLLGWGGP